MKRKLLLAFILTCMVLAGCKSGQTLPQNGEAASVQGEESAPAQSEESPSSEAQESAPEEEKPAVIYGNQIKDGVYPIEVTSSSSMFRIIDARLTVAEGKMTALLTLSGTGYEKLYPGTGEQALAAPEEEYIYFVKDENGKYTYEVPVAALNEEIDCAAWSIRKEKWYDRVLVFQSSLISPEALVGDREAAALADGEYTVEAVLSGGSGRSSVESPARLSVKDGEMIATVVWSSPYYEYMKVDGATYYPIGSDGNSTFEIPVILDADMPLSAQTVAMSTPHEVDYTLRLDCATLKPVEKE